MLLYSSEITQKVTFNVTKRPSRRLHPKFYKNCWLRSKWFYIVSRTTWWFFKFQKLGSLGTTVKENLTVIFKGAHLLAILLKRMRVASQIKTDERLWRSLFTHFWENERMMRNEVMGVWKRGYMKQVNVNDQIVCVLTEKDEVCTWWKLSQSLVSDPTTRTNNGGDQASDVNTTPEFTVIEKKKMQILHFYLI